MYHQVTRTISLLLAVLSSTIMLVAPQAWVAHDGRVDHLLLMVMLLGIMLGFINGIGFHSETRFLHYLFHPVLAWTIMGAGLIKSGLSLS